MLLLHVLTNDRGPECPPADGSNVSKPSSCNNLSYWKWQAEEKDCSAKCWDQNVHQLRLPFVFMGPDVCSRFGSTTKEWCFKVFMYCDDEILKSLASLGNIDPSPETCTQLERFVCMFYRSKVCTKVNELRWFLYSNIAAEGENLPPITGSLTPLILWAHYILKFEKKS